MGHSIGHTSQCCHEDDGTLRVKCLTPEPGASQGRSIYLLLNQWPEVSLLSWITGPQNLNRGTEAGLQS